MEKTNFADKLKSGLVRFAAEREITPKQFAEKMGYQYPTAWDLLRGKRPFTAEAFGRFSIAYGTQAAAALLGLAEIPDGADVSPIGELGDGKVIPLVTVKQGATIKHLCVSPTPKTKLKRVVVESDLA